MQPLEVLYQTVYLPEVNTPSLKPKAEESRNLGKAKIGAYPAEEVKPAEQSQRIGLIHWNKRKKTQSPFGFQSPIPK